MDIRTEGITVLYHPGGLPRIKKGPAECANPYWVLDFPVNPERPSGGEFTDVFLTKAQLLGLYREASRALEQWGCVDEADLLIKAERKRQEEY